jgi:hypothetical protein
MFGLHFSLGQRDAYLLDLIQKLDRIHRMHMGWIYVR